METKKVYPHELKIERLRSDHWDLENMPNDAEDIFPFVLTLDGEALWGVPEPMSLAKSWEYFCEHSTELSKQYQLAEAFVFDYNELVTVTIIPLRDTKQMIDNNAVIFYHIGKEQYGYRLTGTIWKGGIWYQSLDHVYYKSADEAETAARKQLVLAEENWIHKEKG